MVLNATNLYTWTWGLITSYLVILFAYGIWDPKKGIHPLQSFAITCNSQILLIHRTLQLPSTPISTFLNYSCLLQTWGYSKSLYICVGLFAYPWVFICMRRRLEHVQDIYIFSHRFPALTNLLGAGVSFLSWDSRINIIVGPKASSLYRTRSWLVSVVHVCQCVCSEKTQKGWAI